MIIDKFEELVKKEKNNIAVKEGTRSLTYDQLNSLANRTARTMISQLKVARVQQVVALLFDQEIDAVVAVLATLKAQQVYVPLDSTYPVKRLQYMLEDSGAGMIVTNSQHWQLARQLADETAGNITILNINEKIAAGDNEINSSKYPSQDIKALNQSIAYILYTSGSSGKPKGVVQTCENLYFYTRNYIDVLSITPADRTTFLSSFSHDGAIQDIYSALLSGATLYPFNIKKRPVSDFPDWLAREKITLYHSVPSVFRYVTSTLTPAESRQFPGLRLIVTGGEPLVTGDIDVVRRCFPGIRLAHMYGQTESSVNTMGFIDVQKENPSITLGNQLDGIELFLLNQEVEEVEEFETAEIFVSSKHIALGYCNAPVYTNKNFFYDEQIGGIYRTGDLGSRGINRCITFQGRRDSQVKIRGYRIELEEIENLLRVHEKIENAVVIARKESKEDTPVTGTDDTYLAAYCVPARKTGTGEGNSDEFNARELRNYLSLNLPDYMIPLYIEEIDMIPLSPTGKPDRDQLPPPGARQMINYFIRLIRENLFKGELNGTISGMEIDILSEEKRKQLLYDSTSTQRLAVPGEMTLHGLFEEQAARIPDNIAVAAQSAGQQAHRREERHTPADMHSAITYRQLNERANQLAGMLRKKGITANSVVGLLVEPSIEMVVGIMGILKAGGAYLAVDPQLPENQMNKMLTECQPSVLLTNESTYSNLSFSAPSALQIGNFTPHLTAPSSSIDDLNRLPLPDRSLVDYETYSQYIGQALVKNSISLQATRGCPYNCAYCHKIQHKNHRVRSAQNIFSEVKLYYDMGVRRFAFIDDVFNLDRKNSMAFFQLVLKNKLNTDARFFFPNGMRGDILTREYIDLMIEAGAAGAALALETASPRLQKLIGKNLNLEKLEENLNYITHQYPSFILELFTMHGFPSETEEEAMMTLEFIKRIEWIHFPYVNILRIYSNTDMEQLAIQHGISREAILKAENLAFHELPDTLPFERNFTLKYQAHFLDRYFLSPERLLQVLPHQMKVLTEDEMVQKYNSYLDFHIHTFDDLLGITGVNREQLEVENCLEEDRIKVPHLNKKMKAYFTKEKADANALNVLLLDLSQLFSTDSESILYDLVEPPLGLVYIMSYLQRKMGSKVNGKIAKSRIDFDRYAELKTLLEEFQPDVIGIRTLTLQKRFFHKTVDIIRQWGFEVPLIVGGPYATTNYETILQNPHVDLVVLGEGEVTFCEIIEKIMENQKKLPAAELLSQIPGLAFVPAEEKIKQQPGNNFIFLDRLSQSLAEEARQNPENLTKSTHLANISFSGNGAGRWERWELDHQHMNNLVSGLQKSNLPLAAAVVFDSSSEQVLRPLTQGGSLYIAPGDARGKGVRLFELYKNEGIYVRMLTGEQGIQRFMGGNQETGPGDELEEKLLGIWAEILGMGKKEIDINSSFFELGGHSLRALMVISSIHKLVDVLIPVGTFLLTPTIKDLAAYIKEAEQDKYTAIEPGERKEYYTVSSAQKRLFLHQQLDEQSIGYNLPKVLNIGVNFLRENTEHAFRKLIKRHDSLRTSFDIVGNEPVQKVHETVEFEIEYYEISKTEAEEEGGNSVNRKNTEGTTGPAPLFRDSIAQIIKNFIRPFDLSQAPLLRVGMINTNREKCLLLIDMHHIISDLATHTLLKKDFMSVYREVELPPLKLQYKDYSEWQTSERVKTAIRQQEAYWSDLFSGKAPVLELPTDYPRPGTLNFEGDSSCYILDAGCTDALEQIALEEGTTMYMVLLAIFYVLLSKLSSQEDIVVGTPVAGRRHADLENIVGIFLNMLPLRNFPAKEKSFVSFLNDVKQQTMNAFENQDYPFEKLVEKAANRDVSRNPLFDVMFEFRPDDNKTSPGASHPEVKIEARNTQGNHPKDIMKNQPHFFKKTSTADLILCAYEKKGTIFLNLEYSSKLFKRETATAFLYYYKMIAESIIENKHIKIKQIELVEEEVSLNIQSVLEEDMENIALEVEFEF